VTVTRHGATANSVASPSNVRPRRRSRSIWIEDREPERPRPESDEFIVSIGSVRPMEDAARAAYADLVTWMADDHGFDEMEAYMLLTQVGHVRLGNMVDPNYTVGAGVDRSYL
jgi:acetamidase/formamidase